MTKRTTDEWQTLLDDTTAAPWLVHDIGGYTEILGRDPGRPTLPIICDVDDRPEDAQLIAAAPEAVAEVVRLLRELEEFIGELNEDLAHEGIENYEDISDAWPSMQEHGELAVKLAHRNILTRILEGGSDE